MTNEVRITFVDGAKVEIVGDDLETYYEIEFIDTLLNECVYQTKIQATYWAMANPRYYVPWRIVVDDKKSQRIDVTLDLRDRDVLVVFDSKSLGDNVSWMPFVEEFRQRHGCRLTVMTFWNNILSSEYPDIRFVEHGEADLPVFYTVYKLGAFDDDYNRNKNNWRLVPLQQIASDILGIPYAPIRPRVKHDPSIRKYDEPYVCFSEHSTWFAKRWLRPGAWQQLIERIREQGYHAICISREPTDLRHVIRQNGRPIEETINTLQHAKAFVGVSTGLLVVAWALDVPTVCISGSTGLYSEFEACRRVVNTNVCHGCFSNLRYKLDRGNWKFCPAGRNYECSREITVDMAWKELEPLLPKITSQHSRMSEYEHAEMVLGEIEREEVMPRQREEGVSEVSSAQIQRRWGGDGAARVLFVTPHCSTGGGPQYLLKCVELARFVGHEVEVVEYSNISDRYTVQRNKLKALVPFHTLDGDKVERLSAVLRDFGPDIVHLHEFPENFMDEHIANLLYDPNRNYRIIETAHGISISPGSKRYRPDAFAFVSHYHANVFKDYGVPMQIVEYQVELHKRPDRVQALEALGLDPGIQHVLQVGLFAPWKNQAQTFEVARRLLNLQFHFVGNMAPNFEMYWKPLVDSKPSNVVLWGERDDVDRFYAAMDVLVFPSTRELFPLVVKEALAWQMPVLMRDLPQYGHAYDNEPLVTYISDDIDEICRLLLPSYSMVQALSKAYKMAVGM